MPVDFRVHEAVVQPEFLNWGQRFLQLPAAWRLSRGGGERVGVIDTGMAIDHPDLRHAIVRSKDFSGSSSGVVDEVGHGTHVAGIIAALDDDRGVVGVAPEAGILNAKVLRRPGAPLQTAHVADAIRWCAAEGAKVVCLSLTWNRPVDLIHAAIQEVVDESGAFVVCAAGNRGGQGGPVGYPARYSETLGVGYVHVGPDGLPRGTVDSAAGPEVDVVAPGGEILSTYPPDIYALASGTSMAAPFVAGALALLLSHRRKKGQAHPDLPWVRTLLRRTAKDLYTPGKDPYTGWGIIDPNGLLSADQQ